MGGRQLQAVLFDLDGTLADTAPDLADALNGVLNEQGLKSLAYEQIRPIVSNGTNALIELGFGLDLDDTEFNGVRDRLLEIYTSNIANKTQLFEGMERVLDEIEQRQLKWGVITNKPSWLTNPLMSALTLNDRAACIVSGDTTKYPKPHPAPMQFACKQASVSPKHCLYIGDAQRDIDAGREVGMTTLAALFGYIGNNDSPEHWGADGYLHHPLDIIAWLDQPLTGS